MNSTNPASVTMDYFLLPMAVLNVMIALLAAFLNLIIIVTFCKTASLRTPSYLLILGLAVADFCAGVIAEPLFCALMISHLTGNSDLYNTLYPIEGIVFITLAPISFYTLTAITIDRFLAIHLHLRYQLLVTKRRYQIVLAFIWIFSTSLSLCLGLTNSGAILVIIDVVLLLGLIILNAIVIGMIYRVINRHSAQIKALEQSTSQQDDIDMPRYKKSVNTMYLVIGAFVFCYVPHSSVTIVEAISSDIDLRIWFTITETFVMLNSVLNPLIYCWRVPDIKNAAYQILHGIENQP